MASPLAYSLRSGELSSELCCMGLHNLSAGRLSPLPASGLAVRHGAKFVASRVPAAGQSDDHLRDVASRLRSPARVRRLGWAPMSLPGRSPSLSGRALPRLPG